MSHNGFRHLAGRERLQFRPPLAAGWGGGGGGDIVRPWASASCQLATRGVETSASPARTWCGGVPGASGAGLLPDGNAVTLSIASEEMAGARVSTVVLLQKWSGAVVPGGGSRLSKSAVAVSGISLSPRFARMSVELSGGGPVVLSCPLGSLQTRHAGRPGGGASGSGSC